MQTSFDPLLPPGGRVTPGCPHAVQDHYIVVRRTCLSTCPGSMPPCCDTGMLFCALLCPSNSMWLWKRACWCPSPGTWLQRHTCVYLLPHDARWGHRHLGHMSTCLMHPSPTSLCLFAYLLWPRAAAWPYKHICSSLPCSGLPQGLYHLSLSTPFML